MSLKGQQLPIIPNLTWADNPETLVIAIRSGCHYCEDSLPFYRRISDLDLAHKLRVHAVIVTPNSRKRSSGMLLSNSIALDSMFNEPFPALKITGTPTILLVDSEGKVEKSWIGELSTSDEEDVFKTIKR